MKAARLVVLVVAVASGGIAAVLASRDEKPPMPSTPQPVAQIETVEILVAKADIAIGQSLSPQILDWQTWPTSAANSQFIRKTPSAIEQVVGSITRTSFASGEPIRESKLIKANGSGYLAALLPDGMRAIAAEITPETGVGGFVLPNDRVDVILTRANKLATGEEYYTSETILKNVRVLAIDQTIEEKNGQKVVVGKIATLELKPAQTETLALARRLGSLSLVLRSLVESSGATGEVGNLNRRESISVVRFGHTSTAIK